MEQTISLLQEIRKNPQKYISRPRLDRLKNFVQSYEGALSSSEPLFFKNFNEYLQECYGQNRSIVGLDLLRINSIHEEIAFDRFYEYFDRFLESGYKSKAKERLMDSKIWEIPELLQIFREKPRLCFGYPTVACLKAYLDGYIYCHTERDPNYEHCMTGFDEFVMKKYGMETLHDWGETILFFCYSEDEAYNRFFELYDEFTAQKQK